MENLEKIIPKLFNHYLGREVDITATQWYEHELEERGRFLIAKVHGVSYIDEDVPKICVRHNITTQNKGLQWLIIGVCKLVLKPIDTISDEDAIAVAIANEYHSYDVKEMRKYGRDKAFAPISMMTAPTFQILINLGYDVKFIELNNKSLIEVGAAVTPEQYQANKDAVALRVKDKKDDKL